MTERALELVTTARLRYLLSPANDAGPDGSPVLCFLHGFDEGAPADVRQALTRHGPLRPDSSQLVARFIIIAPQLPEQGDLWNRYAGAVHDITKQVQTQYGGDPGRTFLTGFSFGGNGVFDLALAQPRFWAALWPVDPTRVPRADPSGPVWLSSGAVSRRGKRAFVTRLHLADIAGNAGDRVYSDDGHDHVGTALSAYHEDRVYRWLLDRRLKR